MKHLLLAALLTLGCEGAMFSQTAAEYTRDIKAAVASRDHASAVRGLQEFQSADPKAFVAGDYDYLLGRMAEANGDLAVAMISYQSTDARGSVLRPYALAHLARLAGSTGNLMLERLWLLELLHIAGRDSLLAGPAAERLANNYFETESYAATVSVLSSSAAGPAGRRTAGDNRELRLLLAKALLNTGDVARAREIFASLLNSIKDVSRPDDAAVAACLALDTMDGGSSDQAPALSVDEHLRRAAVLQADRNFANARLHYRAVAVADAAGPNGAEALLQIGRGLAQQNDLATALTYYKRVLDQPNEQPAAKDALLQSASVNARLQNPDEAIRLYQRYIGTYPAGDKLDRAYLNIVDVLRDKRADDDALLWCQKAEAAFTGKLPAAVAIFTEARIYIARENWQDALTSLRRLETLSDLGGATVPGGTNKNEVAFLIAYCLEQQADHAAAVDKYLSIPDGRDSYYGWRATERLRQLSQADTSRPAVGQKAQALETVLRGGTAVDIRTAALALLRITDAPSQRQLAIETLRKSSAGKTTEIQKLPQVYGPSTTRMGSILIGLGLFDEGAAEIESAMPPGTATSAGQAYALASAYLSGDRGDRVLQFVEPLWRQQPADYPIELIPADEALMLYPAPYSDMVRRYSAERGLDPRFLLAVMRQESGFNPNARSGASARGLLQFIPSTADRIANELGRPHAVGDALYDPGTSILFGSQYLADLFLIFPEKPEAVATSYNGGEDNMARWLARARSQAPERYVPEIVYAQSKDYVHRVMANYRMYCFLYDADLRPVGH